jgi:hypothetical protein
MLRLRRQVRIALNRFLKRYDLGIQPLPIIDEERPLCFQMDDLIRSADERATFFKIYRSVRETQAQVPTWITPERWANAFWRYGVPPDSVHAIQAIAYHVTYTDLILFLATRLLTPIRYLEIGVSVGKNFIPILHILKDSDIYGMDIEEINPVIEQFLERRKQRVFDNKKFIDIRQNERQKKATVTEYLFAPNNNRVTYVSGDKFSENTWKQLEGQRFNLVFSDAFHAPISLLSEFEMIKKYSLLDQNGFVIVYDDLGGKMSRAFLEVVSRLKHLFQEQHLTHGFITLHCSYHDHVPSRSVGVIQYGGQPLGL